ncbi:phosphoesterase family-domain-containing protein [Xylogone sp. PMI_703]|nr:phosphoesterase family-domain-containing protein [Xylogone sp. PMI_703]
MAVFSKISAAVAVPLLLVAPVIAAGSIKDIEHVVLFMQENRAFDHYFGTMAGVRGFSDPNVQVNSNGRSVWQQNVTAALSKDADYLLPWHMTYLGGKYINGTQCIGAGSNGWTANKNAYNYGRNDGWAIFQTPYSWAYFDRDDIPVHYAIADGYSSGDMYQQGVIASTNPNRVTWASGSINSPGSPPGDASVGGYPYIDNNETPGCEGTNGFNCYPLKWTTTPELLEKEGISWMLYQGGTPSVAHFNDNFDDNPLAWFEQYQTAAPGTPLYNKGFVGEFIETFYEQAANGTLPAVSYIIGPAVLSEHPDNTPNAGAWLQKQIVDAVTSSPKYNSTVLMISFDETGGFGDHVIPYHAPEGTPGEWVEDPYKVVGNTFTGPGYRLPFAVVSPWTRGGSVFVEHADHNSQILFLEKWAEAKGYDIKTPEMTQWRREHMSTLVNMFDFENPDYSVTELPEVETPYIDPATNIFQPTAYCQAMYPNASPPVPYGKQIAPDQMHTLSEQGFKEMRGFLTEGRYIVFEYGGFALSNQGKPSNDFAATAATSSHEDIHQRWVVHYVQDNGGQVPSTFIISSAFDGRYIGAHTGLSTGIKGAETYTVNFAPSKGYSLQKENGKYLTIDAHGTVQITSQETFFKAYSVTYSQ